MPCIRLKINNMSHNYYSSGPNNETQYIFGDEQNVSPKKCNETDKEGEKNGHRNPKKHDNRMNALCLSSRPFTFMFCSFSFHSFVVFCFSVSALAHQRTCFTFEPFFLCSLFFRRFLHCVPFLDEKKIESYYDEAFKSTYFWHEDHFCLITTWKGDGKKCCIHNLKRYGWVE